jgi:hypothetical protein
MVSSQRRGSNKPRKSGGKVSVRIQRHIPFNTDDVVVRTRVAYKVKKRVLVTSTELVVPAIPSVPSETPDLEPLPSDPDVLIPEISGRKRVSHSVAVRHPFLYRCW